MTFLTTFLFDFYRTLRFATRLPLPVLPRENDDPIVSADGFAPAFAACGVIVGGIGGVVTALSLILGIEAFLSALLGTTAMILATGALHEDGLADCADGIGGGRTRERKLAIMRDSAIGTYGVLALILSVGGRVLTLATLVAASPLLALAALIATQTLSRAATMGLASTLDHARPDGASARLGKPSRKAALTALGLSTCVAGPALWLGAGLWIALGMLISLLAVMTGLTWLIARAARKHLGGQTGDVLGANQQLTDLAGLITVSISVPMII
ncbi:adenosylcobinamide-GDP ribazoletransferase [Ahrensia marina]|uniref:adenosylcobinamide-GDP ribazoletransferase n=1 Tax=Ahrensia marina TaxID=1514904 RepID=UPI0035CEDC79